MGVITLPIKAGPHYGRKALVGQFVIQQHEGGPLLDQSARINFERSKKYPHSSKRQQERDRLRHFYLKHGYRMPRP
jgi:hypothetical protein